MKKKKRSLGKKAENLLVLQDHSCVVPPFITLCSSDLNEGNISVLVNETFGARVQYFAVRSSSFIEDTNMQANAGMFHSELAIESKNLYAAALRVKDSFQAQQADGCIIIQEFIPSTSSGILFIDSGNNSIIIEATIGLCTSVVAGRECDQWILDGKGTILSRSIAISKNVELFQNGIIQQECVFKTTSLLESQIKKIVKEGKRIEAIFSKPQDIEFCFKGNELFILQARPITRSVLFEETFYDSANIAESYTGIVLPLTFSFANEIYYQVYRDLLVASGVSRKLVEKHSAMFKKMLGHFYGRLYYNMNNWYRMMAFLPGYERNKDNLEHMISSHVRVDIVKNMQPSLWLRLYYPFLVIWKILFFKKTVQIFEKTIRNLLTDSEEILQQKPSKKTCQKLYARLHQEMLRRWYITVENDFLVMTYFGVLRKMLPNEEQLLPFLHFDNIGMQQIQQLSVLGSTVFATPEREDLFLLGQYESLYSKLKEDSVLNELLQDYLSIYGGRFASELKLESPDISEEPQSILSLLYSYKDVQPTKAKDVIAILPFKGIKKLVFAFVLNQFHKNAKKREELRLLRSKAFSIIRRLFNAIGEDLTAKGVLREAADVVYLEVQDLLQNENSQSLQAMVDIQKEKYAHYKNQKLRSHFSCYGSHPSKNDIVLSRDESSKGSLLSGRGCTPGSTTGKVSIFNEFKMPEKEGVEIIVARHTDPGWTPLIGLAKGMIIEQGGLLSHASIVARELGIPTIIGVKGAMDILRNGQIVTLNGSDGTVVVHNESHTIQQ